MNTMPVQSEIIWRSSLLIKFRSRCLCRRLLPDLERPCLPSICTTLRYLMPHPSLEKKMRHATSMEMGVCVCVWVASFSSFLLVRLVVATHTILKLRVLRCQPGLNKITLATQEKKIQAPAFHTKSFNSFFILLCVCVFFYLAVASLTSFWWAATAGLRQCGNSCQPISP